MDDFRDTLQPDTNGLTDLTDPEDLTDDDEDDDALSTKDPLPDWVYEETARRLFQLMPAPEHPQPTGIQLFRLSDGRTAQVHCVHRVPKDLVHTMALHRTTLLQSHPVDDLEQYVIVVGDGSIRGHDDPVHTGTYFGLNLLYLKDIEREWFPTSPGFALLNRCQTAPWASEILAVAGATLEPFVVPPNPNADIFAEIDERQAEIPATLVSLFFAGRFGVRPKAPAADRDLGWATAVTTALALHVITQYEELRQRIGHREGVADVLGDVLRERFGEHPNIPPLAYRLAALPDLDSVIQIIATADDFDELYAKYLTN